MVAVTVFLNGEWYTIPTTIHTFMARQTNTNNLLLEEIETLKSQNMELTVEMVDKEVSYKMRNKRLENALGRTSLTLCDALDLNKDLIEEVLELNQRIVVLEDKNSLLQEKLEKCKQ